MPIIKKTSNHWEKYKIYYLVGGSFLLLLTFILLVNSNSTQEIKKLNRRLNSKNHDLPDAPPPPPPSSGNDHGFKSGEFITPSAEEKNEKWLEETVFQDKVREEFQVWVNSVKYLPQYKIGGLQEPEQHALFYGPPGSGKSYLAEMFARNESLSYINANFGFELYVGSNQVKVNKVMEYAEYLLKLKGNEKPVVIIIDEIDSIGTKSDSHTSKQEVNALLTMIDNIKSKKMNIIVIGITNYPDVLDSALKRAGRLGRQIEVPYLTREEITKMVKCLESDMKKDKEGSYKHEGNKSKWINKDKDKDKEIEWTDSFWSEALQITFENFEKCKQAKVGISYTDLELSIKGALAKKVSKDSKKITPQSADFKAELEKKVKDKIRDKPEPRQPTPQPIPIPEPQKP